MCTHTHTQKKTSPHTNQSTLKLLGEQQHKIRMGFPHAQTQSILHIHIHGQTYIYLYICTYCYISYVFFLLSTLASIFVLKLKCKKCVLDESQWKLEWVLCSLSLTLRTVPGIQAITDIYFNKHKTRCIILGI